MMILISSHFYFPGLGGTERFTFLMARAFSQKGHKVIVMTETPGEAEEPQNLFQVVRRPKPFQLLQLLKGCDIYWQNSISLRHLWANLLIRKPCVISFTGEIGQNWFVRNLKYFFLKRFAVVSVSKGIASFLPGVHHQVIHNAFESKEFSQITTLESRKKQLVFVGRLIREKGVDTVLQALALLKKSGCRIIFTVIGSGYEEESLKAMSKKLGLGESVHFAGARRGPELNELINQHQVMIVPSNCPEAFGIVALEGIACGCPVIASDNHGLPEAVGPVGLLFERGNIADCAAKILQLVDNLEFQRRLLEGREAHLAEHSADYIANLYLKLFQEQVQQGSRL